MIGLVFNGRLRKNRRGGPIVRLALLDIVLQLTDGVDLEVGDSMRLGVFGGVKNFGNGLLLHN